MNTFKLKQCICIIVQQGYDNRAEYLEGKQNKKHSELQKQENANTSVTNFCVLWKVSVKVHRFFFESVPKT